MLRTATLAAAAIMIAAPLAQASPFAGAGLAGASSAAIIRVQGGGPPPETDVNGQPRGGGGGGGAPDSTVRTPGPGGGPGAGPGRQGGGGRAPGGFQSDVRQPPQGATVAPGVPTGPSPALREFPGQRPPGPPPGDLRGRRGPDYGERRGPGYGGGRGPDYDDRRGPPPGYGYRRPPPPDVYYDDRPRRPRFGYECPIVERRVWSDRYGRWVIRRVPAC